MDIFKKAILVSIIQTLVIFPAFGNSQTQPVKPNVPVVPLTPSIPVTAYQIGSISLSDIDSSLWVSDSYHDSTREQQNEIWHDCNKALAGTINFFTQDRLITLKCQKVFFVSNIGYSTNKNDTIYASGTVTAHCVRRTFSGTTNEGLLNQCLNVLMGPSTVEINQACAQISDQLNLSSPTEWYNTPRSCPSFSSKSRSYNSHESHSFEYGDR